MTEIDLDEMRLMIPEKFRASQDAADKAAYELLQENDRIQAERAKESEFVGSSPNDIRRAKARVTVSEYEEIQKSQPLAPNQREELAEAYAAIGYFDKAGRMTLDPAKRTEYFKLQTAVWMDDEVWCKHGLRSKYIKLHVWSLREKAEMPVIACNECGLWNVTDSPETLRKASMLRAEVRTNRQKMSDREFDDWIAQFKRNA